MSLEELSKITTALTSTKKKDRVNTFDRLQDLLKQEDVLHILNSKNSILSWNTLFIKIHNAVLQDVDKADSKSTSVVTKQMQTMENIIDMICKKSVNADFPLLNCDTVVCNIRSVFESSFRMKYLGSVYTDFLTKYVLGYRKFWGEMKLDQWIGLKDVCTKAFNNPPQKTQSVVYLDALSDIVRLSCKHVPISQKFLDLFSFVTDLVQSFKNTYCPFGVSLLKLINTLCLQLAIEFRYKVCKFMEDIFEFVLSLYEKKRNSKNPLVFHFLITYLNVHNPNGVSDTDNCFYAFDNSKWREHVISIYTLTQETSKQILRNTEKREIDAGFFNLMVEINHLVIVCGFDKFVIMTREESDDYSDSRSLSNKRKRSVDCRQSSPLFSRSLSVGWSKQMKYDNSLSFLVQDLQTSSSWFWLKFLQLILGKYPESVTTEFRELLEVLSKLLHDSRDSRITKAACRCVYIIASKEAIWKTAMGENEIKQINEVWHKIGVELIRLLKVDQSPDYHRLIESLIINSKFSNPQPLIELYAAGAFSKNIDSFLTLMTLCQNSTLPDAIHVGEQQLRVRSIFLDFLFKDRIRFPAKELSKLVITLMMKKSDDEAVKSKCSETLIKTKTINDFCKLINGSYETVSLKTLKFTDDAISADGCVTPKIDCRTETEIYAILDERFRMLNSELLDDSLPFADRVDTVKFSVYYCEFLLNFYTFLIRLKIKSKNWNKQIDKLKSFMFLSTAKCYQLLKKQFFSLACFSNMYGENYHEDLNVMIRRKDVVYLEFMQYLFEVFNEGFGSSVSKDKFLTETDNDDVKLNSSFSSLITDSRSVLHANNLTEDERRIIEIVELLCHFMMYPATDENNQFQKILENKFFQKLMDERSKDLNSNFYLQMVFRVVYNFSRFAGIDSDTLNNTIKLLSMVFESKKTDSEMVMVILQIMKELLILVNLGADEECESNFIKLIDEFRSFVINKEKCGIAIVLKYIDFLCEMIKKHSDKKSVIDKRRCKYLEDVVAFLRHPYCQVRIFAAQNVGNLFASTEKTDANWQCGMMSLLKEKLQNSVQNIDDDALVLSYYNVVDMSVCAISWASVVCLSRYWRRSALFCLLHQGYTKDFTKGKMRRIIKLICSELNIKDESKLMCSNLTFLMNKWAESKYRLEDFPYHIVGATTLEEFISNNLTIILLAYLWHGQQHVADNISEKLGTQISDILKDCYADFMAIILPSLSENIDTEKMLNANRLKNFMDKKLGIDSYQLISDHIHKIIYKMFYYIEDNNYLNALCNVRDCPFDENDSMRFTVSQIFEALENISQKNRNTLMGKIALDEPSAVQKVLLNLSLDVDNACSTDDKMILLYKYVAFAEVLTKTTRQTEFRNVAAFIARDIIFTLMSFIRTYKTEQITEMCLKCLEKLSRNYIREFRDILNDYLPVITMLCKPLVLNGSRAALDVLNFLICDNFAMLQSAIASLDPFPRESVFVEINNTIDRNKLKWTSLEGAVDHFLDKTGTKRCGVESVNNLREILTDRKEDLKKMFDDLNKLRGFSEDCGRSLIHRLICALIELTRHKNRSIRVEASKCLGEIGPSDLTTLVLKPENLYVKDKLYNSPVYRLLKSCITDLNALIIHENIRIKSAASDLLHTILSTVDGNRIIEEEEDPKIKQNLLPFLSTARRNLVFKNNAAELKRNMDGRDLWSPENHENWVVSLVVQILKSFTDSCGLAEALIKMSQISWNFAERILPNLLDIIFSFGDPAQTDVVNGKIELFFEEFFYCRNKCLDLNSLQCMVNVVDYIRIQRNYEGIHEEVDLKINNIYVAEAARRCSAFFTSILYVELWYSDKKKQQSNLTIDDICELCPEEGSAMTKILRDCYSKIGIYDGVLGCGYTHLLDLATESQHYEHSNKSMLYHDIELSLGSQNSEQHLMSALHQSGMLYTANNLSHGKQGDKLNDVQYKCAADLGDWSLCSTNYEDSYESCHYFALKAFHEDDQQTFLDNIGKARTCTLMKLSSCSLESVENLYQLLSELRCLKELEDFGECKLDADNLQLLRLKWQLQDCIKYSDFKLIERVLTQRGIIIKEEIKRSKDPGMRDFLHVMLCEVYFKLTKTARKEKQYETAMRNLNYLSRLENLPDTILEKVKLEKSLLNWESGNVDVGKFLLCHYLKRGEIKGDLNAKALRIYGDWMAATNSENSRHIIEEYYNKSISVSDRPKDRVNAYASLAKFADSNYEQIKEYLSSPLFEIKKSITNRQQDMAMELRQEIGWNMDREKKIAYRLVERQSVIDENEIKNSESEMDLFLCLAVKYYLLSLKDGNDHDMLVFRLISLWFSNPEHKTVTSLLKEYLDQIPTYKFLCLLPQIAPRMDEIGLISAVVEQSLNDHPHHTLPVLSALANSFADAKYGGAKQATSSQRALIARGMLEKCEKEPKLKQLIVEMDQFCDALIEFANSSPGEKCKPGMTLKISPKLKISRVKNLNLVPVPSQTIPYKKSCKYEDVIGIKCFEDEYQLVGGINVPKKINCIGSDGKNRPLLVKGRDDLRQDAVMQQVFTVMNTLLHGNPDTSRRKLVIRTYNVVPLSQRSGIIEWCEKTQPLSIYLIGPDSVSGAHKRFNPGDVTAMECRARMRRTFEMADVTNDMKLRLFLDICEKFRPAFRHFFFENFPEPGVWFERRLAYTNSVATSSMIGYVLGIGDRHVHNILIDNTTAEVIHIDLGIAFEQGKTLPTPETVPFRLTRDIVDGMGVCGVEGVFRQSCIKTMKVLRENRHTILTLLEVLLYDPLYAWTITAEKAYSVQGHNGTESSSERDSNEIEINKMAERALIRLKQKLQGTETGGIATNCESQVNCLIQQARDPNNLCRLFHGWQPYL